MIFFHGAMGKSIPQFQTMFENSSSCCWENEVGDEVFKLVLVDLGLFILIGVLLHLTRAAVVKFCCCRRVSYSILIVFF